MGRKDGKNVCSFCRRRSWDSLLHEQSNGSNSLLVFKEQDSKKYKEQLLSEEEIRTKRRSQRAIGVVYNPVYERYGNYVPIHLTKRYDAFLHIDETHALHPLHMPETKEDKEDLHETFPTGL
jgi:hypothetical protein